MSEAIFFATKGKQNERKVVLQAPTCLVSKPPTKQKRIRMKFVMPLSSLPKTKLSGTPDWMLKAMAFVQEEHDEVKPKDLKFNMDIQFAPEANLFGPKALGATKCLLKGFKIYEAGDSEDPDVVIAFYVYASFSAKLWTFCGNMSGEEIFAKFTPCIIEEEQASDEPEFELTSGEDNDQDVGSEDLGEDEEDDIFEDEDESVGAEA